MTTDFPDLPGAACAKPGAPDPEAWFPVGPAGWVQSLKAIATCRSCPVVEACAEWAIARPELAGLWGGLTERQRQQARKDGRPARVHGQRTHCSSGRRPFTDSNTEVIGGKRRCRTCHNERTLASKRRAS